jgi:hypothetical protein
MEDYKMNFCGKCGILYSDSEIIYASNQITQLNILYYAHNIKDYCEEKECNLINFKENGYMYCIEGDYNEMKVAFKLLKEDEVIKVDRNVMYMVDLTTGFLLDNVLKTKI